MATASVPKLNLAKLGIKPNPNAGKAKFDPYATSGEWGLRVEEPKPVKLQSKLSTPSTVSADQLAKSLAPAVAQSAPIVLAKPLKIKSTQSHAALPAPRVTVPKAQTKPKTPAYELDSSSRCPPAAMPVQSKVHVNQSCLQEGNIIGTRPSSGMKTPSAVVHNMQTFLNKALYSRRCAAD